MAEKVEIDIPGIGLIEAKNAATEATLMEILDVLKGTQKDANKNSKGKGGSGQGGGSKEAKEGAENQSRLNKETKGGIGAAKAFAAGGKLAGSSLKLVGQAAHLATYAVSGLAAGAGAAAGAMTGLVRNTAELGNQFAQTLKTMSEVGDSTTAAAGALRMIPLVGPALSGAFGAVAGAVEGSVKSYQTAASVGATFNGSVQDMSRAASGAGMTLDQFANLIKNNAENLIYLGGTTEAGAKQFAGLAKELQGSGAGAELQRLGFTTEQINSGMAKYIGILGKTGALSGMTTSQIAAASGSYLKELDGLAKITGQTREAKQAEQDALMRDAQVRAAMAGMDAESQKQMMNYITSFPKEQQAAIKDMIATGNVTSEEAIKLQSMLPGVAEQTMQFGRTMQAGGKINADQMNSARNNAIREAKDSVMRNKARGMYDKEAGEAYVGAANLAAMEIDGLSKAMGEQGKATDKANLAENLTKAKQRLAEFSNAFQQALANPAMLDMLMKSFETLASFVQQVIVPAFNIFAQILSAVIPVVTNLLMPAFKVLGEFMQSTIIPAFNILGIWVRDAIVPIFKEAWSIIGDTIGGFTRMLGITSGVGDGLGVFEEILYNISYFIEDNLKPILLGFGILIGAVIVAKVVAFGAAMLAMLAPIGSFVLGLASGTLALLRMAVQVGIAAVQFVASLTMMAVRLVASFTMMAGKAVLTGITMLAALGPVALIALAVTAAIGGAIWGFKKLGGDLTVLTDAFKWAGSWVNTLFLKLQLGIYSLLNKIPGMRGDFDKDIQGIGEKLKENEDNRAKLEEDMAKRRKENIQRQKDDEAKALAEKQKSEADQAAAKAQADANSNARDVAADAKNEKAAKRDEDRRARAARREQDAIQNKETAELSAIDAKTEREKEAAAEAKGVTVDKSDPLQMLKTFASQQKSAFTQEAKALDDKDKARSDLALASQEYAKAVEQNGKATNDMERKAAEARMKAAEERLGKANKANESADEVVKAAAERMKSAKQGKDPGAVATASPTTATTTTATTAAPSSTGTPTVDTAAVTQGVGNLYQQTQEAINKGIKYGFGSKDLKTGAIDCSGWIANINTNMMNSINKEAGKEIYGKEAKKAFQGSAADIIKNVSAAGGGMLEGSAAIRSQLKEGMLIGEDNGAKGWDAGRHKGIDHITQTVKDPKTGKLMISESQGGKGVTLTDPEEYFKKKEAKGVKLFGTDMTAMAKGAEGRTTAPPSATANMPGVDASGRATAATDPRLQRPAATTTPTPQAQGEVKKEEGTSGTLQGLMRDGIIPTTMAFQDLVNKGIKPFQGMLSGVQVKTPLKSEVPVKESLSPGEQIVPDKGAVRPEDSLKAGEEIVKATAEAQAKLSQAKITPIRDAEAVKPTETYTINGKSASKEEFDKFMKDNPELAKMMGKASAAPVQEKPTTDPSAISARIDEIKAQKAAGAEQSKAVQASMTEGAKFMFEGFDSFATDLSGGMTKTFSFVGTDLSSTFSDKLRGTFDDSLGLFTTDLADNFSAFESLDLPSMVTGLDDYTKQIYAASDEIAKGEAAIAQQESAIASAAANLEDPSVTNKDEIASAVAAMQDNINLQKATIAYNKDVIDKNIMARAETPLTELVAQANKDAQEKIRLAEEAAAEKERQAQAGTMLAGAGQEGALSGSSDLNTALAELIAIGKRTADLNEKQLSVQSSLSGDLFA